jgi:hypothetical protein
MLVLRRILVMKGVLTALALAVAATMPVFAQTFTDSMPYCKAVGTIDKPDARCTGPKLPAWMAERLHLQPDEGKMMEWRCANGTVLACLYGANIPCGSKVKTSRKPTPAIVDYCSQNPDSAFVPMVVTRSAAVDAQGYQKDFWKVVSP